VQGSNTVRLGNAAIEEVRTSGTFFSSGNAITSDERLKEGVVAVKEGLALVNDLNPVSYHRINNKSDDIEMGLLAQEVEETLAAHGLRNSGMVQQANEDAYRTVRYNDLLAPMIRAIQELDDAAETKDQQIASLQEQLKSQQEELLAVVQSQQEQMAMQQEQMAMQQEQIAQLQRVVEHQFASR
jgi:septal ring factor EnvC (AmiA/AmiB activator)